MIINVAYIMMIAFSMYSGSVELGLPTQYCFMQSDVMLLQNYSKYNYHIQVEDYTSYKDDTSITPEQEDIFIRIFRVNECIQEVTYNIQYYDKKRKE